MFDYILGGIIGGALFAGFIYTSEKLISKFVNFILYGSSKGGSSQRKS